MCVHECKACHSAHALVRRQFSRVGSLLLLWVSRVKFWFAALSYMIWQMLSWAFLPAQQSWFYLIPYSPPHTYLKIPNNTSSLHLELPIFLFSPCYNNAAYCPSLMEVKILMNPFSKRLLLLESTNIKKMAQQLRVNTACIEDPAQGGQHFWLLQAPTHTHTSLKREKNKTGLKDLFHTFSLVFTIFFQTKLYRQFSCSFRPQSYLTVP